MTGNLWVKILRIRVWTILMRRLHTHYTVSPPSQLPRARKAHFVAWLGDDWEAGRRED